MKATPRSNLGCKRNKGSFLGPEIAVVMNFMYFSVWGVGQTKAGVRLEDGDEKKKAGKVLHNWGRNLASHLRNVTNNNRVIVMVLCFFPCFCSPRDKSSALWRSHRGAVHQPQRAEDALCSAPLAAREPGYRRSPRCSSCRKLNSHRGNFLSESDLGNQRKTLHPDSFTAFQRQTPCQPLTWRQSQQPGVPGHPWVHPYSAQGWHCTPWCIF